MFRITAQTLQYQLGSLGRMWDIRPMVQELATVKSTVQRILLQFLRAKKLQIQALIYLAKLLIFIIITMALKTSHVLRGLI